MSKKLILVLFSFVFLFSFNTAYAGVIINEIAWMGTQESQYGEWIELFNEDSSSIDLSGWGLYESSGEVLIISLSKIIGANGYLLIERTTASSPDPVLGINDESGPFGGSGLSNTGEYLVLKDEAGNVIDSLDFSSMWPAGNAETKETMQKSNGSWITASPTPKAQNNSTDNTSSGDESSSSSSTLQKKEEENKTGGKLKMSVKSPSFISIPVDFKISSTNTSCRKYFINFGDGSFEEVKNKIGEKFSHIYYYTGEYVVTLDCFKSYSKEEPEATDKIVLKIISSDISISRVGEEKDFFLEITNDTSYDADISSWFITGESKKFIFPKNTIIKSKNKITLSPKITGFSFVDKNFLKLFNSQNEMIFNLAPVPNKIVYPKTYSSYKNTIEKVQEEPQNQLGFDLSFDEPSIPNKYLKAEVIGSEKNLDNNFKYGLIGLIIFVGFSAGVAYFIRNYNRVELIKNEGDDFEIIDE